VQAQHVYKEGYWSPQYVYVWMVVIINASQCWALYCLALFYLETRALLKPLSPAVKFAQIKLIIFAVWWQVRRWAVSLQCMRPSNPSPLPPTHPQAVIIAGLAALHVLPPVFDYHSGEETAKAIANYLIVVEMFIATLMHHRYFAASDFVDATGKPTPLAEMRSADDQFAAAEAAAAAAAAGGNAVSGTSGSITPSVGLAVTSGSSVGGGGGGGGSDSAPPTPAGMATALKDVLPGDILAETAHHLRTGFGLKHKWEKRKRAAEEAAASDAAFEERMGEFAATGQYHRSRQSRFTSGSGLDGDADGAGGGDDSGVKVGGT